MSSLIIYTRCRVRPSAHRSSSSSYFAHLSPPALFNVLTSTIYGPDLMGTRAAARDMQGEDSPVISSSGQTNLYAMEARFEEPRKEVPRVLGDCDKNNPARLNGVNNLVSSGLNDFRCSPVQVCTLHDTTFLLLTCLAARRKVKPKRSHKIFR